MGFRFHVHITTIGPAIVDMQIGMLGAGGLGGGGKGRLGGGGKGRLGRGW